MTASIDYADKIDKMLRKAESTTPEEAEAFLEKAYALMAKYSVSRAEIDARRLAAGGKITEQIVERSINITGIFRYGLQHLAFAVTQSLESVQAYMYDKQVVPVAQQNGKTRFADAIKFVVVGYETDVEQALTLLVSLQLQAAAAMTTWWGTDDYHRQMARGPAFRAKRQFIMAFGQGAGQKIRLAVRRARATGVSSGAELVLRDKSKEVDRYLEQKGVVTKRSRLRRDSWDAQHAGYDAGQRANTGDTSVGQTSRRELRS